MSVNTPEERTKRATEDLLGSKALSYVRKIATIRIMERRRKRNDNLLITNIKHGKDPIAAVAAWRDGQRDGEWDRIGGALVDAEVEKILGLS